jgi:hypothetical protein
MMDKKDKKLVKEIQKQKTGTTAIPINERLKVKVSSFVESVISVISAGKMEPDHALAISRTMKDVLDETITFIPGIEELSEAKRNIAMNFAIGATINAIIMVVQELQKNKILFDNRQVIVNAMHGEMLKSNGDDSQFLVTGADSLISEDISEYTDDPKILRAYDQFLKKLKH